eukprot:m.69638 g.69638  ORF g.69638 m.69638 type:complete len:887 (+) comp14138_c0_seq2:115-2775(+)
MKLVLLLAVMLTVVACEIVSLTPSQDTTIYETESTEGDFGAGSGHFIVVGATQSGAKRRALLQFSLDTLPTDANVVSATLRLVADTTKTTPMSIFRLSSSWVAGSENPTGPGMGAPVINGSGWHGRNGLGDKWLSPGGDFASVASDTASLDVSKGYVDFDVTSDVQHMLNATANYGWIIAATDEAITGSANRFFSSENITHSPTLVVEVTEGSPSFQFACFHQFETVEVCNTTTGAAAVIDCLPVNVCQDLGDDRSLKQICSDSGMVVVETFRSSSSCGNEAFNTNLYDNRVCTDYRQQAGYFTCEFENIETTASTSLPGTGPTSEGPSTTLPTTKKIKDVCWEGYSTTDCSAGTAIFSQCAREELCQHVDVNESTVQRCLPDQSVEVDLFRGTESCEGEATMTFNIKHGECVLFGPTHGIIDCVSRFIPLDEEDVNLEAAEDATLYEAPNASVSTSASGGDDAIFVGRTRQSSDTALRRAVVRFDLTMLPPSDGELVKASLVLTVVRVSQSSPGATTVTAHRVLSDWVEGNDTIASSTGSNGSAGGAGTSATGGATWYYSDLVNETLWSMPGGDYAADASAQGTVEESVRLVIPNLVDDVKDMLANPEKNHGWLLKALDETNAGAGNALRVASSEAAELSTRPVLLLTYLVEQPPTTMQPTTTSVQATTRTASPGSVFIRTTYAIATNVDAATLERDLTSVIAVALTQAGLPTTLEDVVVSVQRLTLTRRSANNWQATVFVSVEETNEQATKDALQKIQDDDVIRNELRALDAYTAVSVENLEGPTTVTSTGDKLGDETEDGDSGDNRGVVAAVVVAVLLVAVIVGVYFYWQSKRTSSANKANATTLHNPTYEVLMHDDASHSDVGLVSNDGDSLHYVIADTSNV